MIYVSDQCPSTSRSQQSTYDFVESIATHPESDLDDEQLRALLTSPLCLQEREASAERSQAHHSEPETRCPVHLKIR